jgi:hypothetical protein
MSASVRWTPGLVRTFDDLAKLRFAGLQVAQYVAVLSGIRRSLDDWVPGRQFEEYRRLIGRLGLTLEIDCAFVPIPDLDRVIGLEYAPTTRFAGRPFSTSVLSDPHASVHVVVAGKPEWAADTLAAGWYPLVLDNRVTYKPRVDFLRLGLAFGYPECCVRFFLEHNDWPRQNTMAESARASRVLSWKANCVPKNTPCMLIFHMPCAFDCQRTMAYSEALLSEIAGYNSHFAAGIEAFLRQTFLVTTEKLCFRLVDASQAGSNRVRYRQAETLHRNMSGRDPRDERYLRALAAGNEVSISDGSIFVWENGTLRDTVATRCDDGVAEVPLLLRFE